jgi:hypothetical protein
MDSILSPWAWTNGVPLLAAITSDGMVVYGLFAFVIAWSKYTEPPISNPYPDAGKAHLAVGAPGAAPAGPASTGADPAAASPAVADAP